MIKPLNLPQLSAAKTRTGLQSISDLLPRLIRQYELQAEMMKLRDQELNTPVPATVIESVASPEQETFAWYE